MPDSQLSHRIESIRRRIGDAASRSGRAASSIRVVAATKTVEPERILEAAHLGISEIAENRVQEAMEKRSALTGGPAFTHHFIGQLQTNKSRRAVELFDVIQSVDRPRLAQTLDRAAAEFGKRQRCLIEVKISDDEDKGGCPMNEAARFISEFDQYKFLSLEGLMGIAPVDTNGDITREAFRKLARIFNAMMPSFGPAPILSMGMSDDFEIAIEEGSTMIRLGRSLFGERVLA